MTILQCLLCNQYAEISKRGGDARKAQLNTLLLATALITLLLIIAFVFYDKLNPGFLYKYLGGSSMRGKDIGRLLGAVVGVIIFILLKVTIGQKTWYDKTIEEFNNYSEEEQKRISRKGIRYFFIASLPVILFILDALFSLF